MVGGGFGLDLAAGGCVLQGVGGWLGKIKCDDIYISVLLQGSPEGDRSEHIRCLQTAAIVFRESITFAVCVGVHHSLYRYRVGHVVVVAVVAVSPSSSPSSSS